MYLTYRYSASLDKSSGQVFDRKSPFSPLTALALTI
jgi:hypothetical protein